MAKHKALSNVGLMDRINKKIQEDYDLAYSNKVRSGVFDSERIFVSSDDDEFYLDLDAYREDFCQLSAKELWIEGLITTFPRCSEDSNLATSLKKLELERNHRLESLPPEIGNFQKLETLILELNRKIQLPQELNKLSNLKELGLPHNNLNTLPDIDNLTNLRILDLGLNNFKNFPETITSLENLEELWLNHNKLTKIPSSIGKMKGLKKFSLMHNKELEEIEDGFFDLENLEELSLWGNQKLTHIGEGIKNLTNLKKLRLDETNITLHPGFSELKGLTIHL